ESCQCRGTGLQISLSGASHCADSACGVHFADTVILPIRDNQAPGCIDGDAERPSESRGRCGSAVSAETCGSIACHRADDAVRIDLAHSVRATVGNEQVAEAIQYDIRRGC